MTGTRGWSGERIGSLFVTVITVGGALVLSWSAFGASPPLASPGTVFVGVKHATESAPVRVDVRMDIWASADQTALRISLVGDPTSPVPQDGAGDLILGFCGAMKDLRLQKVGDNGGLASHPLLAPSEPEVWSSRLGPLSDCRMVEVPQSDLTGTSHGEVGRSWALPPLEGETSAATEASDGAQYRYVLPNIVSTSLPHDGTMIDPVARESMASLTPHGIPGEYVPSVVSPQLNDSGVLAWKFPLASPQGPGGYRLTGTDQREATAIQGRLFISSALCGVAGGALIWFLSTFRKESSRGTPSPVAQAKMGLGRRASRRSIPRRRGGRLFQ